VLTHTKLRVCFFFLVCLFAICLELLYSNRSAQAQNSDSCGCNAVLIPTVRIVSSNKTQQLAYLKIIDKATFEELKKSSGGGGSLAIGPLSIGGGTSWDEFSQKRERLFQQEQFSMDYNEASNLVTSGIPQHVTTAWTACKQSCGNSGFGCWAVDSSKNTVTVTCAWTPPVGGSSGIVRNSTITGGSSDNAPAGRAFPDNYTFAINSRESFIFRRELGETFRLVANVNGYTTSLVVPPPAPVVVQTTPPPPPPLKPIYIRAIDFVRSRSMKVQAASADPRAAGAYGGDIIMNAPDYNRGDNTIEYDVYSVREGVYKLWVEYASQDPRPVKIYINGDLVMDSALSELTGGFAPQNQQFREQGTIRLKGGQNTLKLHTDRVIPHIRNIRFDPVN
jgi:hypothetical protein